MIDSDRRRKTTLSKWGFKDYLRHLLGNLRSGTVFSLPSVFEDTFALYHSTGRTLQDKNSAYFKQNGVWKEFTENPIISAPSSLFVDAVVRLNSISETIETNVINNTKLYPNPVHDELTLIFKNEKPISLNIISDQTCKLFH